MPATRCSCGFERLPDEELTDHLLTVFDPPGSTGADGLIHEERASLTCSCGFAATSPEDLDEHFLSAFTPVGAVGRDGQKHEGVA